VAQAKKKAARKKVAKKAAKKTVKKKAVRKATRKAVKKKVAFPRIPKARVSISAEERHRMVAECAYYRAINSGPQSPEADRRHWLDAEGEIDALIRAWSD
jgi:hypothetical protein